MNRRRKRLSSPDKLNEPSTSSNADHNRLNELPFDQQKMNDNQIKEPNWSQGNCWRSQSSSSFKFSTLLQSIVLIILFLNSCHGNFYKY